jgi:hypothetical protein
VLKKYGLDNDPALVLPGKEEWIVYDALYAYCQEMLRKAQPNGAFK